MKLFANKPIATLLKRASDLKLFAKKPVGVLLKQASEESEYSLKRGLGPFNLTTLGIGVIIGAGIFVLTGQAAATHAGPGIVLSFLIAGFVCALAALCYAELASMIPVSGSAYTYTFATLGELFAWIIAWDLIVEYLFAAATVAVGWSGYFVGLMDSLFGVHISDIWSKAPLAVEHGHQLISTGAVLNVPAMAIIALTALVLILGITQSAAFNNIVVAIKVGIILIVIGVGFMYVQPELWAPFIPDETVDPATGASRYGFSGVFTAAGIIFFAYIGFEALSTAAQETHNPQRNMPIGILGSLAICTVLYILMSLVMTGLAPYTELNVPAPVYVAVSALPSTFNWLPKAVTLAATIGLASTVMGLLYGQSRIFYSMSRDGLLPPIFSKVHPKRRTPWVGTLITAFFAGLMAGLFPIGILGELVSVGTLLAFAMICAGVLYLRRAHPELPRPFKTPFVWVTAPLGVVSSLYLVASLPQATFVRLLVWLVIGLIVYATYAYWHSRYRESAIAQTSERTRAA